jgi:hypothetical protein
MVTAIPLLLPAQSPADTNPKFKRAAIWKLVRSFAVSYGVAT